MRILPTAILALAASPAAVLAGPVDLSETQMDRVTAGQASTSVLLAYSPDTPFQQENRGYSVSLDGAGSGNSTASGTTVVGVSLDQNGAQTFKRTIVIPSR